MGLPGFEPGSHGPKPRVLSRLYYRPDNGKVSGVVYKYLYKYIAKIR